MHINVAERLPNSRAVLVNIGGLTRRRTPSRPTGLFSRTKLCAEAQEVQKAHDQRGENDWTRLDPWPGYVCRLEQESGQKCNRLKELKANVGVAVKTYVTLIKCGVTSRSH